MATKKSTKRTTKSSKKPAPMRSFKLAKDEPPFTTFKFTKQTLYWTILIAVIVIMQLWILKIQMDIADLTQTIITQSEES